MAWPSMPAAPGVAAQTASRVRDAVRGYRRKMRSRGQACGRGGWSEAAAVSPVSVGAALPRPGPARGSPWAAERGQ